MNPAKSLAVGRLGLAKSGKHVDELTLAAVRSGDLGPDDIRIHPDSLIHQAEVAESHHNPQLGQNLRRAAELTAMTDSELMKVYDMLRPGRATIAELRTLAADLGQRGLELCAGLVTEAADVYERRGLAQ